MAWVRGLGTQREALHQWMISAFPGKEREGWREREEGWREEGTRKGERKGEGRVEGGGRKEGREDCCCEDFEMHKNLEQETKSLDSVARPRHERQEHLLSQRVVRNLG